MNTNPFPDTIEVLKAMEIETLFYYSLEYPKSKYLHEKRLKHEPEYQHSEDYRFFIDFQNHYTSFLRDYPRISC
jgi:hypothetical protein